jgi:Poly(ADP-ribose) polymerase catalytic domain/WWE domain
MTRLVEILHDTGTSIATEKDYLSKFESTRVGTKSSSRQQVAWAWEEDSDFLGNHDPSTVVPGTSWVKYNSQVSANIESSFPHQSSIYIDLSGHVHKFRNGSTGLKYKINFLDMTQTNTNSYFVRPICRHEHFVSYPTEATRKLPKIPLRNPFQKGAAFLPTFQGQVIHVTKSMSHNQWHYGKVVYDPNNAKRSGPSEGWFPAVFCKTASQSLVAKVVSDSKVLPKGNVDLSPPDTWDTGKDGLVTVSSRSHAREYKEVVDSFKSSLNRTCTIVKLERIQSLDLWRSYAVKKHSIEKRYTNGGSIAVNNTQGTYEMKWLFHGTKTTAVSKIIKQGFNRSFAGINGTAYGKGVYFADTSAYSRDYANPDSKGQMKMFLCRVAVGDWCHGKPDQLTPDKKTGSTSELFDSTVNDEQNPSIYVVYHDAQVYPEYLITFT